jgi:hypothetical protein
MHCRAAEHGSAGAAKVARDLAGPALLLATLDDKRTSDAEPLDFLAKAVQRA